MAMTKAKHLLVLATLGLSLNAYAQTQMPGFRSLIEADVAYDDNVYRVTENLAQSDTYIRINPEFSLTSGIGKHSATISYEGDFAKFVDLTEADYDDHRVHARINFDHSLKFSTRFDVIYEQDHDQPGARDRVQLDITEYDKFDRSVYIANASYGRQDSVGRVIAEYRYMDRDYTNNNLDSLDAQTDQFSLRFSYRIAPFTRAYILAIFQDVDYLPPSGAREIDNTFSRYRAGITWRVSDFIEADINIGLQDRDYEDPLLQDIDGLAYDSEINWFMSDLTKLQLNALRESNDSTLVEVSGGFLRTQVSLSLEHKFTDLTTFYADAVYGKDDIFFASNIAVSREDDRMALKIGFDHQITRLFSIGASYTFDERDSDFDLARYKSNVFMLTIKTDLET